MLQIATLRRHIIGNLDPINFVSINLLLVSFQLELNIAFHKDLFEPRFLINAQEGISVYADFFCLNSNKSTDCNNYTGQHFLSKYNNNTRSMHRTVQVSKSGASNYQTSRGNTAVINSSIFIFGNDIISLGQITKSLDHWSCNQRIIGLIKGSYQYGTIFMSATSSCIVPIS